MISDNDWFGELAFISGMPRKASAKSLEYSSLFYFPRATFLKVLKSFHYDYEKFCYIKDRINIYENYIDLQVLCLSCRSCHHLTKECGYVTYVQPKFKSFNEKYHSEKDKINDVKISEGFVRRDRVKLNARLIRGEIEEKCELFYQENLAFFELESPQLNQDNKDTPLLQTCNTTKLRKGSVFSGLLEEKDIAKLLEKKETEKNNDSASQRPFDSASAISFEKLNKKLMSSETLEIKKIEIDKFNFMMLFEKAKTYDLYFPHNNYNFLLKKMSVKVSMEVDKSQIVEIK